MRISLLSLFSSVALAGQCNDSELELWNGRMDFTEQITYCAVQHFGSGGPVTQCLIAAYGGALSGGCAECFGNTVECGKVNCAARCVRDAGSADCLLCTEQAGCVASQNQCTGFSIGPLPPVSFSRDSSPGNGAVGAVSVIGAAIGAVLVFAS